MIHHMSIISSVNNCNCLCSCFNCFKQEYLIISSSYYFWISFWLVVWFIFTVKNLNNWNPSKILFWDSQTVPCRYILWKRNFSYLTNLQGNWNSFREGFLMRDINDFWVTGFNIFSFFSLNLLQTFDLSRSSSPYRLVKFKVTWGIFEQRSQIVKYPWVSNSQTLFVALVIVVRG